MSKRLGELRKGQGGRILSLNGTGFVLESSGNSLAQSESNKQYDPDDIRMIQRLMEMGLLEGAHVEVLHEAPLTRDPIVVRVRGALIALRRAEANQVWLEVEK